MTELNSMENIGREMAKKLTSVGIDKKEYGSIAVNYLLDRIENPMQSVRRFSIVPSFVKGETARKVN